MKLAELKSAIEEIRGRLVIIEQLAGSWVDYQEVEPIIDSLAVECARLGIDGLPREYIRQCQTQRKKIVLV